MPHKKLVKIPRATLDFYRYEKDGLVFYEFDATQSSAPEPMMNAMVALEMIKNENERLVGIFFHEPIPLLQRVSSYFSYTSNELENGDYRIIFKKRMC
jgi:hypothetical protein